MYSSGAHIYTTKSPNLQTKVVWEC